MTSSKGPVRELFVSPDGRDEWSGRSADATGDDGPLRSLEGARNRLRQLKAAALLSGPVTVWFADGRYEVSRPVEFGPRDTWPVTYAAKAGARAVIDGGRRVSGWEPATLNGRAVWRAAVPEVKAGKNYLSFFVDGERRPRAHFPKTTGGGVPQWLWMRDVPGIDVRKATLFDGTDRFVVDPADFVARENLGDVEVVVMHYWVDERMPVGSYDPQSGLVVSPLRARYSLRDDYGERFARYYLDNVKEALTEPGEWYLDRATATLYYMPRPGETPDGNDYVLPQVDQLVRLVGDGEKNEPVSFIRFEGLSFRHADATRVVTEVKRDGDAHPTPAASGAQSAVGYGGAIELKMAQYCAIESCEVSAVGWYGIAVGEGCVGNRLVGNHLFDIGAGGLKIGGAAAPGPRHLQTGLTVVSDNVIRKIGRVFHAGAGVLVTHGYGNRIIHNHISDAYYTGISVGWVWGYGESVSCDNRIEWNHIHTLGQGWLSDMGGVYTLGVQPGTTIKHNLVHDIHAHGYGGWGIYPDEGSSHIVIEHNVVHDCKTNCFNQHYGRENIVRNNVFANGGKAVASLGRREAWLAFSFERNVCVTGGAPVWLGDYGADLRPGEFYADGNLYAARSGQLVFSPRKDGSIRLDPAAWRQRGYDRRTVFVEESGSEAQEIDLERGVMTVKPDSHAERLGIVSIDLRGVGPRPVDQRD